MREADFDEFSELLTAAFDILGKTPAAKVISPTALALWFQALVEYPLPAVRAGLSAQIKRGTYTPVPADVVGFIESTLQRDNRPGGEEAWALALSTLDDVNTVVWTQEAADAFGKARPVLESSGPISARKTFLEIYERLVAGNRQNRVAVSWFVSPGSDVATYQRAIENGRAAGLLPAPDPKLLLEDAKKKKAEEEKPRKLSPREQLAEVRRLLLAGVEEKQRAADEAIKGRIEEEDEFKRDLAKRVAERQAFIRMADEAQVARQERDRQRHAAP